MEKPNQPVLTKVCHLCGDDFEVRRELFFSGKVCPLCDFEILAEKETKKPKNSTFIDQQ